VFALFSLTLLHKQRAANPLRHLVNPLLKIAAIIDPLEN